MKKSRKKPITPRSVIRSALRQVWLRSRERTAALKKTGNCCSKCGVKASKAKGKEQKIEVHHANEIDWEDLIDMVQERLLSGELVPLCPCCHDEEHTIKQILNMKG